MQSSPFEFSFPNASYLEPRSLQQASPTLYALLYALMPKNRDIMAMFKPALAMPAPLAVLMI